MMKTGQREHPFPAMENGPKMAMGSTQPGGRASEVFDESVSPERADEIEEFTHGIMPPDHWVIT